MIDLDTADSSHRIQKDCLDFDCLLKLGLDIQIVVLFDFFYNILVRRFGVLDFSLAEFCQRRRQLVHHDAHKSNESYYSDE